ncbi:MAG: DUF2442 domain-containing protein [Phycisphaerales bacterium]
MRLTDEHIALDLSDGRHIRTPLEFYPSLKQSSQRIRDAWEYLGWASALEWPDLDLQLSVDSIVQGRREVVPPAGFKEDTARALAAWRAAKARAKKRAKR